jgi:hypothetical protein
MNALDKVPLGRVLLCSDDEIGDCSGGVPNGVTSTSGKRFSFIGDTVRDIHGPFR